MTSLLIISYSDYFSPKVALQDNINITLCGSDLGYHTSDGCKPTKRSPHEVNGNDSIVLISTTPQTQLLNERGQSQYLILQIFMSFEGKPLLSYKIRFLRPLILYAL